MDLKTLANPFQFADLDIRTATGEHSEIRFCAKDVCAALDIACSGQVFSDTKIGCSSAIFRSKTLGDR